MKFRSWNLFLLRIVDSQGFTKNIGSRVELHYRSTEPSSGGCVTDYERIRTGCLAPRNSGNRAIAAPQKPVFVDIIEKVALHDIREIYPLRLHLAPSAPPGRDSQIPRLTGTLNDSSPVSVKPFFDLMCCHSHGPTSFLCTDLSNKRSPRWHPREL
jgi:hypothetical protein